MVRGNPSESAVREPHFPAPSYGDSPIHGYIGGIAETLMPDFEMRINMSWSSVNIPVLLIAAELEQENDKAMTTVIFIATVREYTGT